MILAFIIIVSVFGYLTTAGFVGSKIQKALKPGCTFEGTSYCDDTCGHSIAAFFGGICWPVALPVAYGIVRASSTETRSERRQAREIEEAEHKAHLAEIRARETAALERALRS